MVTATAPRSRIRSSKSQATKAPRPADLLRKLRKMTPGPKEFNETLLALDVASILSGDMKVLQGKIMQSLHPELCKAIEAINATRDDDHAFLFGSRMDLYANGWFPTVYVSAGLEFSSIRDPKPETVASDIADKLREFAKQLLESADKIEATVNTNAKSNNKVDIVLVRREAGWRTSYLLDCPSPIVIVRSLAKNIEYGKAKRKVKAYNRNPKTGLWAVMHAIPSRP